MFRHNNSGSRSTKGASDWVLVYVEDFETRTDAVQRELEIKRKKSRKYIERLIKGEQ
jgi:putative endonuclease